MTATATATGTAVRGPGPALVPGGGTAGLVPVPAEEKNCAFLEKQTEHLLLLLQLAFNLL